MLARIKDAIGARQVLMDIRHELKILNSVFGCRNFQEIPNTLKMIRTNTGRIRARKRAEK